MFVKLFPFFCGSTKTCDDALSKLTQNAINPLEISEEHKDKMKNIMRRIKCRKGFECCKSGLTRLCPVFVIGSTRLITCCADNPLDCGLRFCLGRGTFCHCPLRRYIVQNFNI